MALTDSASMRAWAGSYTPHGRSQWAWTVTGRNRRDSRICTTPLHNEVIGSETCGHADRQGTLLLLDITPQHLPHRTQVKPGYSRPRSCQVSPLSVASVACPKSLCVCLVPLVPATYSLAHVAPLRGLAAALPCIQRSSGIRQRTSD